MASSPSDVLCIKGLPAGISEDELRRLLPPNFLSNQLGAPIQLLTESSAKVFTRSIAAAQQFLTNYNKKALPGTSNKLTVQFYVHKENGANKSPTRKVNNSLANPPNIVSVRCLPSGTTILQLCEFVNQNICTLYDCPQPVFIFPSKPGTPFCSAKVSFPSASIADQFISFAHGRPFSRNSRQALQVKDWGKKKGGKNFFTKPTVVKNQQPATPTGKRSPAVFIKGLPEGTSANFIRTFINAPLSAAENPNVTVRPGTGPSTDCTAKIIFQSEQFASQFISDFNGGTVAGTDKTLSVMFFGNEKTADSVHVKGLPNDITEESLMVCIQQPVATKKDGKPKITLFGAKDGYRAAKIVFINVKAAKEFIDVQNNRPLKGHKNKLTAKFWEDIKGGARANEANKQADKVLTTVRNVVFVTDLPKTAYKKICIKELEYTEWKLKKIKLHTFANDTLKGEGLFSFENHASALKFIEKYNGKRFGKTGNIMKMSLFQSSEVRRLPNAKGTDHLFVPGAVAYAYDCVTCFDTWDERDMLGCVPIEHNETDIETHYVCQTCAQGFATSLMTGGKVGKWGTGLPCMTGECGRVTLWAPVKRILDENVSRVLETRMDPAALAAFKDIEFCKYCPYGLVIDSNKLQMQYFTCHPECGAKFCRICRIDYAQHVGKSCEDADPQTAKDKARKEYEEALTQIVVRICPKCNMKGVKDDTNCNHINCKNCATDYCYMCCANLYGTSIYGHFQNGVCKQSHQDAVASDNAKIEEVKRRFAGRF